MANAAWLVDGRYVGHCVFLPSLQLHLLDLLRHDAVVRLLCPDVFRHYHRRAAQARGPSSSRFCPTSHVELLELFWSALRQSLIALLPQHHGA